VIGCWRVLERKLPKGLLWRVRLFESPRNFVDYYGAAAPDGIPEAAANGRAPARRRTAR